jgi:lipopolysaccharide transport system permease protein
MVKGSCRTQPCSFWEITLTPQVWGNLLIELTRREFAGRYRGSLGGLLWTFAPPLLLLGVYTFAFRVVLDVRWGLAERTGEFALAVFAGLIVFNAFSDVLGRSATLITDNANLVKKVVFPIEILPVVTVAAALLHALVATCVWFLGHLALVGLPPLSALASPLVLAMFAPVLLGLGWLLACIGVVLRDVAHAAALSGQALLFLSPVFYSAAAAPEPARALLFANPLTFVIEQFRGALFAGAWPDWAGVALYAALATAFAVAALMLFRRLRPVIADAA